MICAHLGEAGGAKRAGSGKDYRLYKQLMTPRGDKSADADNVSTNRFEY